MQISGTGPRNDVYFLHIEYNDGSEHNLEIKTTDTRW